MVMIGKTGLGYVLRLLETSLSLSLLRSFNAFAALLHAKLMVHDKFMNQFRRSIQKASVVVCWHVRRISKI